MPFLPGDSNNNTLTGTSEADGIAGFGGDDIITGGRGGDAMEGGAGRDIFRYTSALDSTPTQLDNLYDFTSGEDLILLQAGLYGVSLFRLNDGSSLVFGTNIGGDIFALSAAGRAINGYDIVTNLSGGTQELGGPLVIYGSNNADGLISHYYGSANITGGLGGDTIIFNRVAGEVRPGNGYNDIARYTSVADSTVANPDTIFGFTSGQDTLDLRLVRTGSVDTVGIAWLNGSSFIFVDIGGNGINEMLIQLDNVLVKMSDIIWPSFGPTTAPLEVVHETKDHSDASSFGQPFGFDQLAGNTQRVHDGHLFA